MYMIHVYVHWNLAILATLGTNNTGWISEVAGLQDRSCVAQAVMLHSTLDNNNNRNSY